jgi:hypothetical protein
LIRCRAREGTVRSGRSTRAILIALVAAGCGSFPHPSEDYECERDRDCADGRICRSGWCVLGGRPCDVLECDDFEDCTVDSCAGGECVNEPMEDGTPCGGAGTCVEEATCSAGECLGAPEPQGQPCDDGFFCTEFEVCDGAGACVGTERPCGSDATCSVGSCNEDIDSCEQVAAEDYTPCSDGSICTDNDVCHGGACAGGASCDCSSDCASCEGGGCCRVSYLAECAEGGCSLDCAEEDCTCYFACAGPSCRGTCQEDCDVTCSATSDCALTCASDSQCQMECAGADQCQIECTESAHCLVDCGGIDNCNRGECSGGWTSCPGDVYVCDRPCP